MHKNSVLAIALLVGTIVGAGIFSLPYVISRVGLVRGIFYFIFFAAVYLVIHRMYADLLLKTDESHQFFYVARTYLPRFFANLVSGGVFLELVFVMTIYLILAPSFLKLVADIPTGYLVIGFWALGSFFMLARLSWVGWAEFLGVFSIIGAVGAIVWMGAGKSLEFSTPSLTGWLGFVLPFGPLLFAFSGRPAIGEVVKTWRKSEREHSPFSLPRAIFWGTVIPVILYFVFVVGILTLPPSPSIDAVAGLGFLPSGALLALGTLGFFALWTSYFIIGINLRDTLREDLKAPNVAAYAVPWIFPLLLYFAGVNHFLSAVSFTGSVLLGMEGAAIAFMWRKAFPAHPYRWIAIPLILVFAVAIISGVVKIF
ncbi:MAG: aromatic amino acid transport family protein [Patescibacteria group bacterium]